MKNVISERNEPLWWHNFGRKVEARNVEGPTQDYVHLESSTAELHVSFSAKNEWRIDWELLHRDLREQSDGIRFFTTQELLGAFGLDEFTGDNPDFNKLYEADSAVVGLYVRCGQYLNIPCPGTAFNGDPNISVYVTESSVQKAIMWLVRMYEAK